MVEGKGDRTTEKGIRAVPKARSKEGKGTGEKFQPEEFALHSGRIRGATRLAARGVPETITKREGRWSSKAFMA